MKQYRDIDQDLNLRRALLILDKRINFVEDLLKYWAFSGPCIEPHPSIEDIS
jgi:hypothetical protein